VTATQLSRISKPGGGAVALNASGFLTDAPAGGYTSWASTNAPGGTPIQDYDDDGLSNAVEYVLGGNALTDDLSRLPAISTSGGNILFSFQRVQTSINATTALSIQVGTTLLTWPDTYIVGADTAASSAVRMAYDWVHPPRKGGEALIHVDRGTWGHRQLINRPQ
jgi:hypothetical protein